MIHEVTPILTIETALGTVEAWPDREKPLVVRNGTAIIPLSFAQARGVMQALLSAMKQLPVGVWEKP